MNRLGYRVGEPQVTNAKALIEFEVEELGNEHLLVDVGKALQCEPDLEAIKTVFDKRFGVDAEAMWLCDTPEWAEKRYGPGEAYEVEIPSDAIVLSDLGPDGKLWSWRKPGSNPARAVTVVASDLVHDRLIAEGWKPIVKIPRLEEALKTPGKGGSSSPELAIGMAQRQYIPERYEFKAVKHYALHYQFPYIAFVREKAGGNGKTVFVEVRMLKDAPPITGSDMKTYGPFRKGRVYAIPKANARVFLKHGVAVATRKEAEKPTLKELFKGEVLNGYVEAAKVKPFVEEEEEMEEADEETVRKAREKAERLLEEIREAKGE